MKTKILTFAAGLLLFSSLDGIVLAQSGDQTKSVQPTEKQAAQKKTAGGSATLTGCLSGPNDEGVYELKAGKKEVEVDGLDDLSRHVGQKVRLHGSWAKSSEAGGKESSMEAAENKKEKSKRHFKVASIDSVSDFCLAENYPAGYTGQVVGKEPQTYSPGSEGGRKSKGDSPGSEGGRKSKGDSPGSEGGRKSEVPIATPTPPR